MRRRQFVATAGAGLLGTLSGCGAVSVSSDGSGPGSPESERETYQTEIAGDSLLVESANIEEGTGFLFVGYIEVNLANTTPNAVVLVQDGDQVDHETLETGSTEAVLDLPDAAEDLVGTELTILAVDGGESEVEGYTGGDVLEKVTIEVKKVE